MRHLRPVCLLPAALWLGACPDLDLDTEAPGAVIACASAADCPTGQICGAASGLCFVPGVDDAAPGATLVGLEPATLFKGAAARVVVDVSEVLALPPRLVIPGADGVDADALLVEGDHRLGDTRFAFSFSVADAEARASLVARVALVDPADNSAEIALPAFAIDVEGPALGDGAVVATLDRQKSHARDGDTVSVAVALGEADAVILGATLRQGGAERAAFAIRDGAILPLVLQGLGEGDLVVEVQARDAFGNVGAGSSAAIPVDLTPPTLRLDDLRLDGAAVVDRLVTGRSVSLALRAGAAGGDVLTWCVDGDVVGANGCDEDGDFRPAAEAFALQLAVERGLAALRVVGRDRAFHEGVVEFSLALLQSTEPSATLSIAPPDGQTAVKIGDAITVTGSTVPGAQVGAVIVDAGGRQLSVGIARTTADETGAFATTLIVPPGTPGGQELFVRVLPELVADDGVRVALPPSTSAGLPVDLAPPTVELAVVGGLVQPDDTVSIAWTITGATAATVTGDIDGSETVGPLDAAGTATGVVAVDLTDGDGSREVSVSVRDGAGNVDVAIVTILVNSDIPVVRLLARNEDRPAVLGVRPGSRLRFSGSATDNVIVEQRLSFFDDDGSERVACRQALSFTMSGRVDGGFDVGTVVPVQVGACAGASSARAVLVVQNAAGLRSILEQSLSAIDVDDDGDAEEEGAFYFDDTPPSPATPVVAFDTSAPPGRDAIPEQRGPNAVLVTPTRQITVAVSATDEHPVTATVGGNVSAVDSPVFALPAGPQAFSVVGGDGDKEIAVAVEDEVGHRVTLPSTTIVLDTQRPGQAQVTATVYREEEDVDDDLADDLLSTFFVAGRGNAVEANSRVFVFAAGDDPATAVPLASGDAEGSGAFGGVDGIDVSGLGAPVLELDVVVVDRAGNRAPPLRITRPRFTLTPAGNAIGVRPAVVTFAVGAGALQGGPQLAVENLDGSPVSPDDGDIQLQPTGPTSFSATLGLDADDGLVAGVGTARARVSGRGPNLHPDSESVDAVLVDVDFSGPTVDAAALQITESATVDDTLTGLAGAVQDLAGPDARTVAGFIVRVNGQPTTVRADGGFGPVSLGANAPDTITVIVEKDAADNPGVATTMRAPVVTAIAAAPARVRVGDTVTVTFDVGDEQALDDPAVKIGDLVASLVSRATVGPLTSFTYAATIATTTTGDKPVTVAARDASGHVGDGSRAGIVFVDADAPVITLENPVAVATRQNTLSAGIADVSTTTTTASVRDGLGNFFDGTAFTSSTELQLVDVDAGAGRFALPVPALVDGDTYELRIVSTDVVGNRAERSATFTFDLTPPVLQFPTPPVGGSSLEVAFVATIDDPAATLFAGVEGAAPVAVPRVGPVRVPFAVPSPALDGLIPRPVRFFAVDVAGNTSAEIAFNLTTTPKLQVAGSGGTLCAVRHADDALLCWGDNRDLHLGQPGIDAAFPPNFVPGDGAPPGFIPPTRIWSAFNWQKVAVGGDVLCGIIDDGDARLAGPVRCVGSHRKGLMPIESIPGPPQPNPPPTPPITTPELAPLLATAIDIAMDERRGCAIVEPGPGQTELRCWGESLDFGVGVGTNNLLRRVGIPAAVAVGIGDEHACFLPASRTEVFCVGRNSRGQLGGGLAVGGQATVPFLTLASFDDAYDELIVAGKRTCARRRNAQQLDCVGDNARGAIALAVDRFNLNEGGGPGSARLDATRFQTAVTDLPAVLASAGATTRSCGVGADGELRCLGTGTGGARGDGVKDTQARAVGLFGGALDATTWDLVATIGDTTCAVRSSDGDLLCAGESGHGEIDLAAPATTPRAMPLPPGTVERVAVGERTVCVTINNGGAGREVFCSGDTTDNRIVAGPAAGGSCTVDADCGLGGQCVFPFGFGFCEVGRSLPHPDAPVRVGAFSSIDIGDGFGCAQSGNGVLCAGPDGPFLGRGNSPPQDEIDGRFPRADFVRTASDQQLQFFDGTVVAGDNAACIFRRGFGAGNLACWGRDLVDGDSNAAITIGVNDVSQVTLGRAHGCVQQGAPNEVRCFGEDTAGVRGDGAATGDLTTVVTDDDPSVPLDPGPGFGEGAGLVAGGDTVCARENSGNLRCWGSNRHGVVDPRSGALAFDRAHRPHNAPGGFALAVGEDFACTAASTEVRCWGRALTGLTLSEEPGVATERLVSQAPVGWRTLASGDGFVCGVTDTGVACLGANTAGAFGDGLGLVETPTEVVLP